MRPTTFGFLFVRRVVLFVRLAAGRLVAFRLAVVVVRAVFLRALVLRAVVLGADLRAVVRLVAVFRAAGLRAVVLRALVLFVVLLLVVVLRAVDLRAVVFGADLRAVVFRPLVVVLRAVAVVPTRLVVFRLAAGLAEALAVVLRALVVVVVRLAGLRLASVRVVVLREAVLLVFLVVVRFALVRLAAGLVVLRAPVVREVVLRAPALGTAVLRELLRVVLALGVEAFLAGLLRAVVLRPLVGLLRFAPGLVVLRLVVVRLVVLPEVRAFLVEAMTVSMLPGDGSRPACGFWPGVRATKTRAGFHTAPTLAGGHSRGTCPCKPRSGRLNRIHFLFACVFPDDTPVFPQVCADSARISRSGEPRMRTIPRTRQGTLA